MDKDRHMSQETINDVLKYVGDAFSVGVVVATIIQWLPALAALASLIWTAIRIYETKTVQRLLSKRKAK